MSGAEPFADGLDQSKVRFIDADGVRIRCYDEGTGEPLVLLTGGEYGSLYTLDAWSLNLKELARHFRVIALDKPGQGHSDVPKQDSDFTFDWLYRGFRAALRTLDVRRGNFLGHSRGALLVARLALDHPEMVSKAILASSSTTAPEDPHFPTDLFYNRLRYPSGPPSREAVRVEVDAQSVSKAHITEDFVDRLLKAASLPQVQETQRRMRTLRESVWYPSLYGERERTVRDIDERGLPVPTLVIWSFNDRAAPLYLGHRLFERLAPHTPDAEFHVFNQTGHYSFREQYKKFNRVVQNFCLG